MLWLLQQKGAGLACSSTHARRVCPEVIAVATRRSWRIPAVYSPLPIGRWSERRTGAGSTLSAMIDALLLGWLVLIIGGALLIVVGFAPLATGGER